MNIDLSNGCTTVLNKDFSGKQELTSTNGGDYLTLVTLERKRGFAGDISTVAGVQIPPVHCKAKLLM
jgi:hypothetical protein